MTRNGTSQVLQRREREKEELGSYRCVGSSSDAHPSVRPEAWVFDLAKCPRCHSQPTLDHTRLEGLRYVCLDCDDATFETQKEAAMFWNSIRNHPPKSAKT